MPNKALDLIKAVGKTLQDLGFRERSKEHPTDFTRDRKVGLVGIVSIILNGVRRTTQIELNDFLERLRSSLADVTTYTKQTFAEARQKLRPEAFVELNDALVDRYYSPDRGSPSRPSATSPSLPPWCLDEPLPPSAEIDAFLHR